jgi:hypothetical protein
MTSTKRTFHLSKLPLPNPSPGVGGAFQELQIFLLKQIQVSLITNI